LYILELAGEELDLNLPVPVRDMTMSLRAEITIKVTALLSDQEYVEPVQEVEEGLFSVVI